MLLIPNLEIWTVETISSVAAAKQKWISDLICNQSENGALDFSTQNFISEAVPADRGQQPHKGAVPLQRHLVPV